MTKKNIAVIFGGRSGEHEVSLMSARSVLAALDLEKYNVVQIGITKDGKWLTGENVLDAMQNQKYNSLSTAIVTPEPSKGNMYGLRSTSIGEKLESMTAIDVFFPVLHGTNGEDGTIQGLFELADVAYVGAGVLGSAAGMDKGLFKDVMCAHNIPVVESVLVTRLEIEKDMDAVIKKAEAVSAYPLFVKPANLGSSVGVTKARTRSDLVEGLMEAAQYDRRILIERAVADPREIEISVLGNANPIASIPGEIVPGADFYSYEAKYELDTSKPIIPAVLSDVQIKEIQRIAIEAFQAIDGAGMARVDFLLEKGTEKIYLNEINTIPGFTKISMYPKLWEASGMTYKELVDRLIELAIERKAERDNTVRVHRRTA